MNKAISLIVILGFLIGVGFIGAFTVYAAPTSVQEGADASVEGSGARASLTDGDGVLKQIANIMLYIVGGISVIMLIYGGIRYVTSGGNTAHVTAAKNTIIYSIAGLIIAILAYAIVNLVLEVVG